MYENLTIFQLSGKVAEHAGRRQALLAQNVANADTPGYRAVDLPNFKETLQNAPNAARMRASRPTHLQGLPGISSAAQSFERPGEPDPNGNTVALDNEMMLAVEAKRQHDRALAIYRSALNILRTSIQVR